MAELVQTSPELDLKNEKQAVDSIAENPPRSAKVRNSIKIKTPTKVIDKIIAAINALGKPSSAQAIIKYCKNEFKYENSKMIRKKLKAREGAIDAITPTKFWIKGIEIPETPLGPVVQIVETRQGTGDECVESGDSITISYSLELANNPGKTVEKGKIGFVVGEGDVIKGMDAGVIGLKVKGKRTVTVPWELGYGKRGSKPDIPSMANLVFHVELIQMDNSPARATGKRKRG